MSVTIVRGDARALPLPASSVDLIVTSPPYFALRSYQDGGEHYSGQVGSEATPGEFLDALIECTGEMVRVLKPSGSIWVNLGDKYAGSGGNGNSGLAHVYAGDTDRIRPSKGKRWDYAPKSLMGLPWRYALRCIDELGLILRAEVIWSKPNGLPESVTDRVRRSHEQWFHMVTRPRYYAAVDTIREEYQPSTVVRYRTPYKDNTYDAAQITKGYDRGDGGPGSVNPLGKLPGSVWSIPSQPLSIPEWVGVDHFAAFPMDWPRRLILGWSPSGVCAGCGEGRRPVVTETGRRVSSGAPAIGGEAFTDYGGRPGDQRRIRTATGYNFARKEQLVTGETCGCDSDGYRTARGLPLPTVRPSVVLDPFGGTGTVALMADVLGRHGVSVDMSADYCRAAEWRCGDPGERARAMLVDRPEPQIDGQLGLFEGSLG